MKLSALIVCRNEEDFVKDCIEAIHPYVDEIIFVDNESEDKSAEIAKEFDKVKLFTYPKTQNMGELRQFSLDQAQGEWIWQIDCDEWYPKEACELIVETIQNEKEAISFRVGYHQLSWRYGYKQSNFTHYPDRLYRKDVIDKYDGLLPNDMTKVKPEYYTFRPFLEYDNQSDKSFENPKQPILPVFYYHLARTRGFNFEYNKWKRYNTINHNIEESKIDEITRINQWVSGLYDIEKTEVPFEIPKTMQKVSIIIPNFQYAQYVGDAIESCQRQTIKPYEIIVVDDGSHDNSREIIDRYDVIKKYIQNGGVAHARNVGANIATGDYLIFLDADDEIEPDYIEKTLLKMKGDIQVVYTDFRMFGDVDHIVKEQDYSDENMRRWQLVPSTCALIDRRIFEQVGGFDNGEHYEDWGFWLRVSKQGFNFYHIEEPLFRYRKHGKSRIDLLDERQEEGFKQLRERYNILR
jgi:glycosyltransferase involved in cell wall biosynthesis